MPDDEDECPDTAGDSTNRGCPVADQDKDGVPDADDRCPAVAGLAGLGGCPDKDKDGIADIDDACPETPGLSVQQGCPDQPPPDKAVYFGANKNDWFRTSDETIDEVVEILKKDASLHADIGGHTEESSEGSESGLSDLRAKKVHDYLVSQGIAASRLRYAGYGASRPIGEKFMSDDPQLNRQLNRRVEVRFLRR
ncbi:MAG: OmpA family protein [Lewinellaceae bacterium]|nr:OmpA family protein [Lewinellaceae bacterium]